MLNNMISSALGREGDQDLVRVCLFLLEIPGAVALQEQCSTVHAVISIMYRDALRLGFALHHKAHPSAALNSTHYTLGLEIGDQQTKLNIVCVLWLCLFVCVCVCVWVCACQFIGWSLVFCVLTRLLEQDTIFCSWGPLAPIPHYFHHLCVRLIVQFVRSKWMS